MGETNKRAGRDGGWEGMGREVVVDPEDLGPHRTGLGRRRHRKKRGCSNSPGMSDNDDGILWEIRGMEASGFE
jgi:hypothetical protein